MTKKELQFALMNGGLIKDKSGQWVKHGDKVAWVNNKGNLTTGLVEFDAETLAWYVYDDTEKEWNSFNCDIGGFIKV